MGKAPHPTTTKTGFELSPEARAALSKELDFFEQQAKPAQQADTARLLQLLGTPRAQQTDTLAPQSLLPIAGIPASAATHAAESTGLSAESLGQHIENLRQDAPHLLDLLKQSAEDYAAKSSTSLTDPRFA